MWDHSQDRDTAGKPGEELDAANESSTGSNIWGLYANMAKHLNKINEKLMAAVAFYRVTIHL